jgi:hypothetical protein
MDDLDIITKIYDENCNHSRHHENLRATMTNLIIFAATGLLGLITFDQKLTFGDLPLALFLAILGIFGALFSAKHYERLRLHRGRARVLLDAMHARSPSTQIKTLLAEADQHNERQFPSLTHWKLTHFWTALHLFIAILGLSLAGFIMAGWPTNT